MRRRAFLNAPQEVVAMRYTMSLIRPHFLHFSPLQSPYSHTDYIPHRAAQVASFSLSRTSMDGFPLEELIFSCSICQATISEVYANPESNKGLRSASGEQQEDGIVTKMWIAECSHITCSKHLEGGGE